VKRSAAILAAIAALMLAGTAARAQEGVHLKAYVGGQQRPEILRSLLAEYMAANPGVKVSLEVGGASSDLHQKYLNMVLTARDTTLDVFLIDIIRPAQFAAAGWAEPLDAWMGADRDAVMSRFLPAYRAADTIGGHVIALPAFADSLFLYYRRDLLEKYGEKPPATWPELARVAKRIQAGEADAQLQGISFQGKAVEGTVCTFLLPYWSQGGEIIREGRLSFERAKAEAGLAMWLGLVRDGIAKANVAEVSTDDTRKEFQAGKVVFAVGWGYAWNHFQKDEGSRVSGKVGVIPLPAMPGGESVSCMGGWSWAVSAFSRHKPEAAKLVLWLASPYVSRELAVRGSFHPAQPAVYDDPAVLRAVPWFHDALPVVASARARPVTPVYKQVSDAIRINTSAVMAGAKTPAAALDEMERRIAWALRR
jgi:multiple sugar transport system substrate-binding protein